MLTQVTGERPSTIRVDWWNYFYMSDASPAFSHGHRIASLRGKFPPKYVPIVSIYCPNKGI